jgi:hypothetical protein
MVKRQESTSHVAVNLIQSEWETFAKAIFEHTDIKMDSCQAHEMRKAFFAGAWVMLCNFEHLGYMVTVPVSCQINLIRKELVEFAKQ